jgi:hypothetical protein
MSIARTAAVKEEEAQLNDLRDQADRTAAEAARTLAELTGRLAAAGRPGEAARRLAADARVTALRAVREGPGKIAGQRGAKRLTLAAVPVLVVAAALVYAAARGQLTPAKIKAGAPERIRPPVRRSISRGRSRR